MLLGNSVLVLQTDDSGEKPIDLDQIASRPALLTHWPHATRFRFRLKAEAR